MVDVDEFHRETAEFHHAGRFYAIKRIILNSLLYEFMLAKHKSEFRSVNGNVDFF